MMLITGMLIFGKISVGVRKTASAPMIRMRMAITTIVYGRRNASRTIHIGSLSQKTARMAPSTDRDRAYSCGLLVIDKSEQAQLHRGMNQLMLCVIPSAVERGFIYLLDPKAGYVCHPPNDFD